MSVKQLFDLTGKVAIVTGGTRGPGLQMAEALGEMGASLVLTGDKADDLARSRAHLEKLGVAAIALASDTPASDHVSALVNTVLGRCGRIDILVNNAGTNWDSPTEDSSFETWIDEIKLNIAGMLFLTQEVGRRAFIPQRSGKVIVATSFAGLRGNPKGLRTAAYDTCRTAELNLVRALAAEWGEHNINVNAICPGSFPSKTGGGLMKKLRGRIVSGTALGRVGGDEDLKGAVVLLASEAGRHITGHALPVDGGAGFF